MANGGLMDKILGPFALQGSENPGRSGFGNLLNILGTSVQQGAGQEKAGLANREMFLEQAEKQQEQARNQALVAKLQMIPGPDVNPNFKLDAAAVLMEAGNPAGALKLMQGYEPPKNEPVNTGIGKPSPSDWTGESLNQFGTSVQAGQPNFDLLEPREDAGVDGKYITGPNGQHYRIDPNDPLQAARVQGIAAKSPPPQPAGPGVALGYNEKFLKSTEASRVLLRQTDRVLSQIDNALRNNDPFSAEVALKAFVQSIDNSVVRQAELEGAKDAFGLWRSWEDRFNKAKGEITPELLRDLRTAAVALGSTAMAPIDRAQERYRGFFPDNPYIEQIVGFDEVDAYHSIGKLAGTSPPGTQNAEQNREAFQSKPRPEGSPPRARVTGGVHENADELPDIRKPVTPMALSPDAEVEGNQMSGDYYPGPGADPVIPGVVWE